MKKVFIISYVVLGFLFVQKSYANDVFDATKTSDNITINSYPNPANGTINVELNGNFTIQFFDLIGQKIDVQLIEKTGLDSNNKSVYNIENLTKGIYFIKVIDESKNTQKMVKFQKL